MKALATWWWGIASRAGFSYHCHSLDWHWGGFLLPSCSSLGSVKLRHSLTHRQSKLGYSLWGRGGSLACSDIGPDVIVGSPNIYVVVIGSHGLKLGWEACSNVKTPISIGRPTSTGKPRQHWETPPALGNPTSTGKPYQYRKTLPVLGNPTGKWTQNACIVINVWHYWLRSSCPAHTHMGAQNDQGLNPCRIIQSRAEHWYHNNCFFKWTKLRMSDGVGGQPNPQCWYTSVTPLGTWMYMYVQMTLVVYNPPRRYLLAGIYVGKTGAPCSSLIIAYV